MFRQVDARVSFPEMEEEILEFWRENETFRKSLEQRRGAPVYTFYEGPPTANGRPHIGHVLPRAMKDLFPRYYTMRGYLVPRKGGWDTHGLPVELEVEKELGISGKPDIERYGVEAFVERCRESVWRYKQDWERLTERIGFWMDLEHAYVTYFNDYIESVWCALKRIWERGLLYLGHKVVPYCPRCGSSLSSHEVAQGYREVEDPSIFVRFAVEDPPDDWGGPGTVHFLVWTTTPWTLPSNLALAVNREETYCLVENPEDPSERFILAEALVPAVLGEGARVLEGFPGSRLVGLAYRPLFDFARAAFPPGELEAAFRVAAADFVSLEEGTGIVHTAPAFGEDDLHLGQELGLPVFQPVTPDGRFNDDVPPWEGRFFKDADGPITEHLQAEGRLYRAGRGGHNYPFCWRCDTALIYYARHSWFIRMTAVQEEAVRNNEQVNWYPEHIKRGRFGNFLESMVDWCLSRERYWGTPLPLWRCPDCDRYHCVGSVAELRRMGRNLPDPLDLHKPYIDEVLLACSHCGGDMRRVAEVIDCWFDSGAMPFAQWHYPFENRELVEERLPADFISEAMDQTRGWFYSLLAISTLLFDRPAYTNCLVTEFGLNEQGQKMSKSQGDAVDPWEYINRVGADALRWYLYSVSPPWYPKRFSLEAIADVQSKMQSTLWNVYAFFVLYANLDGFDPRRPRLSLERRSDIDRWLLSRLSRVTAEVRREMDDYQVTPAARSLQQFVDDLSNWYLRRSRRRYWKGERDEDKEAAYQTLYEALVGVAQLTAPFMPFTSEALYRNLVAGVDRGAPESVHLSDFPQPDETALDDRLEAGMGLLRRYTALGRAARSRAGIKVRQPLQQITLAGPAAASIESLAGLLQEELNVKQVRFAADIARFVDIEAKPRFDRLGPRLGKLVKGVAAALRDLDPERLRQAVEVGDGLDLEVDGRRVSLEPDDIEIRVVEVGGFVTEREGDEAVALDTRLTEDLKLEGLSREVVNRIQRLRKDAGFDVADRIITWVDAADDGPVAGALEVHGGFIRRETLSDRLIAGRGPEAFERQYDLDGERVSLGVKLA